MALTNKLQAIADAIRKKTGKTDTLTLDAMVTEIEGMSGGSSGALIFDDDGNVTGTIEDNINGLKYGSYEISFLTNFAKTLTLKKAKKVGQYGFSYCTSLASIDLPVCTSVGQYGFSYCTSLASIDLPVCTSVGDHGFYYCSSLASIDLPVCTSVGQYGFNSCSSLASIDLPVCTSVGQYGFSYCTSLASIDLPVCTSVGDYGFSYCTSLASIDLPVCTSVGAGAFRSCTSLTSVDLPVCTSVKNAMFDSCSRLTSVILRKTDAVATLESTNAFSGASVARGTGYIYVPDALVDSYKTATNWATYAAQIKPLSELPTS